MDINWHLEVLPLNDLKPHPKNPRQISKETAKRLEKGLKKFGLIDKPIVNTNWQIIGGHQRITLLKRMKAKNVECWVPDRELDDKEVEELCITLNLNQGQWDWDAMANNFDPIDLLEYGFSEEQIMGHFKETEEVESEEEKTAKKKKKECPNCGCEF